MIVLSVHKLRKFPVVMPLLIQQSAGILVVASMVLGCASSQSSRVASSFAPSDAIGRTSDHTADSAIQPAAFNESEIEASTTELASVDPLYQVAIEAPPIDLPIGSEIEEVNATYGFTLDTLIGIALSSNPAIAQAESAAAQAASVHCQVGLKPNPSVGYFGQEIGNDGVGGQHGIFASQMIVRGNKLQLNRCVISHDVNRLMWEAEAQRKRVETDVRIRFYRALAAQQRLQRAKEFRKNATTAVDVARQRLDAKEGTKPDLLQSQLLVDQIDLSIRRSELEWQAAWAELAATIGQPSLPPANLVGDFSEGEAAELTVLYEQAVAASPQLSAARARIARAQMNLQRQQNQAVPNLNVQLGVGVDDATDDAFANVQIGMPIPIHNRNQGNVAVAQSEYAAAHQNLQRLSLRLRRDMAEVYRRYQTSAVAIDKYEKSMLPRAEESLTLVEEARRAGEIDFLRVLTARQTLFELQQELISSKAELSQADAELAGYVLTDALGTEVAFDGDDSLRGQALSGQ